MTDVNILVGGEAGQGLVTVGSMMTKSLVRSGYEVHVTQDYMSRIRGGHNTFAIRFGPDPVRAPREDVDVLVALDQTTIDEHTRQLSPRGVIVTSQKMETGWERVFKVPFKELADKPLHYNTVALGVLASVICHDMSVLEELIAENFKKKGKEVIDQNLAVLRAAAEWKSKQGEIFECPAPPEAGRGRLCINGNEAIALGAMAAGVNFSSFYPMTPSTSIHLTLIKHAAECSIVVEQAEDEIAAINMALGASYAGARAMTATSGGGFALMQEGVSLAGMTETPLVIGVVQRPGPATGLPTRTEQGDLDLVLYSGHGEFPRAVFAPGDLEECFQLSHRAFDQAEKHQSPVFILSDQYLADSYRAIEPFDLDALTVPASPLTKVDDPASYERYAYNTETGVSPRVVPGLSEALVMVDSDEHSEDGHITENHAVRVNQVNKRNLKGCGLFADAVPPMLIGDPAPDLLLVCWGSTKGPAVEAAESLRADGHVVGVLHFSQVWPLDGRHFMKHLENAKEVVMVEGNSSGQLARLIRRETGYFFERLVLRYDGLPFTAPYILRGLEQIG